MSLIPSASVPHCAKPVSRIVCGTDFLTSTVPNQWFRAFDAYWEAGGRTFDSAWVYGWNSNLFGAWVHWQGVADEVVFFDKGCHPRWNGERVHAPEIIREEILTNHRRLGVGYTDFFVFHRDDPEVPVGEIVDWMNDFVAEGLIGAFGGSNWTHTRIAEANDYAQRTGKQGFSLNNPNLTLAENVKPLWDGCLTIDSEGRAWHEATQTPLFSWSSTARGYFAETDDSEVLAAYDSPESRARRNRASELGRDLGLTATQVALAWVLNQPYPTFALCGLRTVENVQQNAAVATLELAPAVLHWLEHGGEKPEL